jgi:hypothetical protein
MIALADVGLADVVNTASNTRYSVYLLY